MEFVLATAISCSMCVPRNKNMQRHSFVEAKSLKMAALTLTNASVSVEMTLLMLHDWYERMNNMMSEEVFCGMISDFLQKGHRICPTCSLAAR